MITDNTRCFPTPSFFAISEIDPLNRLKTKNRLKKSKKTKTSIFFEHSFIVFSSGLPLRLQRKFMVFFHKAQIVKLPTVLHHVSVVVLRRCFRHLASMFHNFARFGHYFTAIFLQYYRISNIFLIFPGIQCFLIFPGI